MSARTATFPATAPASAGVLLPAFTLWWREVVRFYRQRARGRRDRFSARGLEVFTHLSGSRDYLIRGIKLQKRGLIRRSH